MEKFDLMIAQGRLHQINERRTKFVLQEISDNNRVAGSIRSDARKILHVLAAHRKFFKITKFGLIAILASYKIGESLRTSLPWLAGKEELTLPIYADSELICWDFFNLTDDSDF